MKYRVVTAVASFASVVVAATLLSLVSVPVSALTATPSPGAITLVIPGTATPSPTPSGSGGSSGGSTGGSSGGSGGEEGELPTEGVEGECAGKNPDGSPIPPAQPKENAPKLTLDKERLQAEAWIIASADGFEPGEKAQIVIYPGAIVIGSYTVDAEGGFAARFRIPPGTLTGLHVLEVTAWESCYVANAEVTIVGAPLASNWLTLWWVYIVLGALFVGLLSLLIAFRREVSSWFGGSGVRESTG